MKLLSRFLCTCTLEARVDWRHFQENVTRTNDIIFLLAEGMSLRPAAEIYNHECRDNF